MQGIFKRGGIYWFRFSHAGKQHRVTLSTSDEVIAIKEARRILANPADALSLPLGWALAAEEYLATKKAKGATAKTVKNFEWQIEKSRVAMGVMELREVTPKKVAEYLDVLRATVSKRSVREYWDYLNWFLSWCAKEGKLRANPCASVTMPPMVKSTRHRFLSKEEIARVMSHPCSPELRFILHCGIHAGLRKEEVIQARPVWFDLDAGLLHLRGYPAFEHAGKKHRAWIPKDKDDRTLSLIHI
jgi:integrase